MRLVQGRFDSATHYGDPFARLADFEQAGAEWVHIVDLDGARAREPVQHELIGALARSTRLKIQCGGGVRKRGHVEALLQAGAARVVVGSAAASRPDEVCAWIKDLGVEQVCCAFDVRPNNDAFEIVVHGWSADAGLSLERALNAFPEATLRHILVTDVSRDGVLLGPNISLMERLARLRPDLAVQASGGVASLNDINLIRESKAQGVIIGRALYEGRFTLEAALAC